MAVNSTEPMGWCSDEGMAWKPKVERSWARSAWKSSWPLRWRFGFAFGKASTERLSFEAREPVLGTEMLYIVVV